MSTPQTWDLDSLTLEQRRFLGEEVRHANGGSMFIDLRESGNAWKLKAAKELDKLGIVEVDGVDTDEPAVSLTGDGERWLLSLPEGSEATQPILTISEEPTP